jgi:hypothetical protein
MNPTFLSIWNATAKKRELNWLQMQEGSHAELPESVLLQ